MKNHYKEIITKPAKRLLAELKKKHKYNARKTVVDGIVFDSKKEADRYIKLKLLARAEKIMDLKHPYPFPFYIGNKMIFSYWADFEYFLPTGERIVEDVKGYKTPVYRLKKKLIEAQFNIKINEI